MYTRQRFPPHLNMLLVKFENAKKMLPNFHVERDKYYVQLKFNARS